MRFEELIDGQWSVWEYSLSAREEVVVGWIDEYEFEGDIEYIFEACSSIYKFTSNDLKAIADKLNELNEAEE